MHFPFRVQLSPILLAAMPNSSKYTSTTNTTAAGLPEDLATYAQQSSFERLWELLLLYVLCFKHDYAVVRVTDHMRRSRYFPKDEGYNVTSFNDLPWHWRGSSVRQGCDVMRWLVTLGPEPCILVTASLHTAIPPPPVYNGRESSASVLYYGTNIPHVHALANLVDLSEKRIAFSLNPAILGYETASGSAPPCDDDTRAPDILNDKGWGIFMAAVEQGRRLCSPRISPPSAGSTSTPPSKPKRRSLASRLNKLTSLPEKRDSSRAQ